MSIWPPSIWHTPALHAGAGREGGRGGLPAFVFALIHHGFCSAVALLFVCVSFANLSSATSKDSVKKTNRTKKKTNDPFRKCLDPSPNIFQDVQS